MLAAVRLSTYAACTKHTGLPELKKEGVLIFFDLDRLWKQKDAGCDSSALLANQQQLQYNKNVNDSPGVLSVVQTVLL